MFKKPLTALVSSAVLASGPGHLALTAAAQTLTRGPVTGVTVTPAIGAGLNSPVPDASSLGMPSLVPRTLTVPNPAAPAATAAQPQALAATPVLPFEKAMPATAKGSPLAMIRSQDSIVAEKDAALDALFENSLNSHEILNVLGRPAASADSGLSRPEDAAKEFSKRTLTYGDWTALRSSWIEQLEREAPGAVGSIADPVAKEDARWLVEQLRSTLKSMSPNVVFGSGWEYYEGLPLSLYEALRTPGDRAKLVAEIRHRLDGATMRRLSSISRINLSYEFAFEAEQRRAIWDSFNRRFAVRLRDNWDSFPRTAEAEALENQVLNARDETLSAFPSMPKNYRNMLQEWAEAYRRGVKASWRGGRGSVEAFAAKADEIARSASNLTMEHELNILALETEIGGPSAGTEAELAGAFKRLIENALLVRSEIVTIKSPAAVKRTARRNDAGVLAVTAAYAAARALPTLLARPFVQKLVDALGSGNENARTLAGRHLVKLGKKAYEPLLESVRTDRNAAPALSVLGSMEDPSLVPRIAPFLQNSDPAVVKNAQDAIKILSAENAARKKGQADTL